MTLPAPLPPARATPATRRLLLSRITLLIPLLTLTFWLVGFLSHRYGPRVERPIAVTPANPTRLPAIIPPLCTRTLTGTVTDTTDAPVDDVLVSLVADDEPHWTYTDPRGRFRLTSLERGPWTVTFTATGHAPFITTLPDEETEHAIRLPDPRLALPAFTPRTTAPLTGRVVAHVPTSDATTPTPTSAPTPTPTNLELVFTPVLPLEALDAPIPRRVECDAAGRFTLSDLQLGEYTLSVLPEWARDGTWPDLAYTPHIPRRTFHHAPHAGELVIDLENGALHGLVLDRDDNPLEGALVLVAQHDAPERVWPPVATDAAGEFRVGDLPPGTYVVSVRAGPGSEQVTVEVRARTVLEVALPPLSVERPR